MSRATPLWQSRKIVCTDANIWDCRDQQPLSGGKISHEKSRRVISQQGRHDLHISRKLPNEMFVSAGLSSELDSLKEPSGRSGLVYYFLVLKSCLVAMNELLSKLNFCCWWQFSVDSSDEKLCEEFSIWMQSFDLF